MKSDELLAMMRESWGTQREISHKDLKRAEVERRARELFHPEQCMCTDCLKASTSDVYAELLRDSSKVSKHYLMPGVCELMKAQTENHGHLILESNPRLGHYNTVDTPPMFSIIPVNGANAEQAAAAEQLVNEYYNAIRTPQHDAMVTHIMEHAAMWGVPSVQTMIDNLIDQAVNNLHTFNAQPNVFERRHMQQQRDHEAKIDRMTHDEMFDWRERMAREVVERPPCPNCAQFSYAEVIDMLKQCPHLSLQQFVENAKLKELHYAAGYVQACAVCAAAPVERRDWIRDIPLDAFRKFQAENMGPYVIDDMKALLPAGHRFKFPIEPALSNGQTAGYGDCNFTFDLSAKQGEEIKAAPQDFAFIEVPYQSGIITGTRPVVATEIMPKEKKGFEFL